MNKKEIILCVVFGGLLLKIIKNQEVIDDEDMKNNAKLATCNVVIRELDKGNSSLSQESQSALGYTWSGTYVNTGRGLSILNKDLKLLGLNRQRIGMVDIYGVGV